MTAPPETSGPPDEVEPPDRRHIDVAALFAHLDAHLEDQDVVDLDELLDALAAWLEQQPRHPRLLSKSAVAAEFGVNLQHLKRGVTAAGLFPEPIPVKGGWDVWDAADVAPLAAAWRAGRPDRFKRPKPRKAVA
jgi:hypothetical protein